VREEKSREKSLQSFFPVFQSPFSRLVPKIVLHLKKPHRGRKGNLRRFDKKRKRERSEKRERE
jgi:hypothetical protein